MRWIMMDLLFVGVGWTDLAITLNRIAVGAFFMLSGFHKLRRAAFRVGGQGPARNPAPGNRLSAASGRRARRRAKEPWDLSEMLGRLQSDCRCHALTLKSVPARTAAIDVS